MATDPIHVESIQINPLEVADTHVEAPQELPPNLLVIQGSVRKENVMAGEDIHSEAE